MAAASLQSVERGIGGRTDPLVEGVVVDITAVDQPSREMGDVRLWFREFRCTF